MSLSCAPWGAGGEGSLERGEPGAAARGPKVQREWVTKMVGQYRKEQPEPCAREFRAGGRVHQPGGPCKGQVGTEGLQGKPGTSATCPGLKPK